MRCYSFVVHTEMDQLAMDKLREKACPLSWEDFLRSRRRSLVCLCAAEEGRLQGCILLGSSAAAASQVEEPKALAQHLLSALGIGWPVSSLTSVSEEEMYPLLMRAFRGGFLQDVDEVLGAFGVLRLRGILGEICTVDTTSSQSSLLRKAQQFALIPALGEEICRILEPVEICPQMGHPAHYMLEMPKHQQHTQAVDILLSSLYRKRRIQRRHYQILRFGHGKVVEEAIIQEAVESSIGGALVLDFITDCPTGEYSGYPNLSHMVDVCVQIGKFAKQVLFVLCLTEYRDSEREVMGEMLENVPFLFIGQERMAGGKAKEYLGALAKRDRAATDDVLYGIAEQGKDGFLETELQAQYDAWYSGYLRRVVYPQYESLPCFSRKMPAKAREASSDCAAQSAYDKLQSFIGLENAKTTIDRMLSSHRAKKLYTQHGVSGGIQPMHMVFTGNPGTAKTSVARLYAQILRDEGVLGKGELVEVSRADLVGKYVGWTARLVREQIRKAKGSILFIDEAYSLLNGREGQFGEEAINTLVMEMENCREHTVIILAGYPNQMEELLQFNPGLRSRIGFHISFNDYSPDEMLQILQLMAKEQGFQVDKAVQYIAEPWFERATRMAEVGNGRFVRNLLDNAKMKQSERLLRLNPEALTDDCVRTLLPQDFEQPHFQRQAHSLIGFQQSTREERYFEQTTKENAGDADTGRAEQAQRC